MKQICNMYKQIVDDFKTVYFEDKKMLVGTVVVFLLAVVLGKLL